MNMTKGLGKASSQAKRERASRSLEIRVPDRVKKWRLGYPQEFRHETSLAISEKIR